MNPITDTPPTWTPTKTYPIQRLPNGDLQTQWTPTAPRKLGKQSVVYEIKNWVSLKRYIGQTTDLFKRTSAHLSHAKLDPDSPLYRDLSANPEDFTIGATPSDEPDQLERTLIEKKRTLEEGYNRRGGGGGGAKRKKVSADSEITPEDVKQFTTTYLTPKKFPLRRVKGRIVPALPRNLLEQKNVVYRIQRATAEGLHVYVGCTERSLIKRLSEHFFYANHPESKKSRQFKLYQDLSLQLSDCSVSIIDSKCFSAHLPIDQREQLVIQFYQNRGFMLYNKNRGGGGGASKK